ncbi:MAG: phage major capsid protein [Clostridia bacterium]|nr:phage major capsid protein [Clostridia bacterium]MBQ7913719.1 phage major capsid protein [Clostridia bacterium]
MVTLSSADSALKSFYLDAMTESLNLKINPFLAKIERTSNYVTGKEVCKTVRVGINGGIGAGEETGDLPVARDPKYIQMRTGLKNLYGTIEISDKAIRASANNEGAFVNLVNEEMQSLIKSASFNFGRMLYGTGYGSLSCVDDVEGYWVYVDNVQNFAIGMYVDVVDGDAEWVNMRVIEVDYPNKRIRIEGKIFDENIMGLEIALHGSSQSEITGLGAIFGSEPLYGLTRDEMGMKPYLDQDFGNFSEEALEQAIDNIEATSGDRVNFIICSWGVRRAIREYYKVHSIPVKTIQIEGGFTAIEVLGIPVVVDKFCPANTMYLLNTDYFKLCQLCDWQWLEAEDGKILKQVPGKPVYTATLVKYAELLCEKPSAQGMLTGVSEL